MAIKVILVAGARPNFMKIAPIMAAMAGDGRLEPYLVHTGQHYDQRMSKLFFEELGIPKPNVDLGVGSGSHAVQTAETIRRFEAVCIDQRPDWVVVVGDVNSTIACALVATKLGVRVAHVEAGLRSFDRTMPEEINRVLTDRISDLLFTTEPSGNTNLTAEGVDPARVRFVGNVMIDTLLAHRQRAAASTLLDRLALAGTEGPRPYGVVTLHRPANVDTEASLRGILGVLAEIGETLPLVFPVHPRTAKQIDRFGLRRLFAAAGTPPGAGRAGLFAIEPQGYLDFLHLMANSRVVLTDSGGLQEETTVLGVPCVTLRDNTERPVTCDQGTNVLAGTDPAAILAAARATLADPPTGRIPELWDGHASERIVEALVTAA